MLLIRTKGGGGIGMGHLMRCLSIAEVVREKNHLASIFVINDDESVKSIIKRKRFNLVVIDDNGLNQDSLMSVLSRPCTQHVDICLMDSKLDLTEEIKWLKEKGIPVLLVDNVTDARFLADVNIYPVAHFDHRGLNWEGYKGITFGGKDWVIIPARFIKARQVLDNRQRDKILVTFGGSDPNRITLKVMDALKTMAREVDFLIVLGPSCPFKGEAIEKNRKLGGIYTLIEGTDHMEELMVEAALGITALGTTIYEFLYMGIPVVVISNYMEDTPDENRLKELGCVIPLGYHKDLSEKTVYQTVDTIWRDKVGMAVMAEMALNTIDGLGAFRVADIIEKIRQRNYGSRGIKGDRRIYG